jgi:TfoX/Sxy family transcriptional regulator of competence genes
MAKFNPKKAASKKAAMPKWEKPAEELAVKFYEALPKDEQVERKKMFGYPCAFVNGNMAVGMFGQDIFVRFDEAERNDRIKSARARPFEPMPGRPMKEYIVLPRTVVEDPAALKLALGQSVNYVHSLPPKEKKKK